MSNSSCESELPTLIHTFPNGSLLEYDDGAFDAWCIYLTPPNGKRHAPKDTEYFVRFAELARTHTPRKVYGDFVRVYEKAGKQIDPRVLKFIEYRAQAYQSDALEIQILLTIVYAGMVAEENKARTKLGKRVKRLGMYQTLIEKMPAERAASFSKRKRWQEIAAECEKRGF